MQVPNEFDFGVSRRTAISRAFANAVPATFAVTRKGWAPCKSACAVHTSAQGYVALIAAGRYDEAYRVASEANPFPSVCGRICTHLCETACARGNVDQPLAIAALKRFVADTVGPTTAVKPAECIHEEKVAIVGAGPAGLTAARDLALLGYRTTVFEAQPVAGGMLRLGIPDYRLPKATIQREIDQILALGVDLRLNQRAGADFTVDGLLGDGYSAVFLATGLQKSAPVKLPGDSRERRVSEGRRSAPWSFCASSTWAARPPWAARSSSSAAAMWLWTRRGRLFACSGPPVWSPT